MVQSLARYLLHLSNGKGLENLLLNLTPSNSTDVYLGYSEGSINVKYAGLRMSEVKKPIKRGYLRQL